MSEVTRPTDELDELIGLFFEEPSELGKFEEQSSQDCPEVYRDMLAHTAHMTVTVERRHECAVTVEVLENRLTDTHYLRKILLRRSSDNRVVQFGIVRLQLSALRTEVRDEIMAQKIPLGRVLIQHNVLRHVQLNAVWEVVCGSELAKCFELDGNPTTFGRTALIYCDGEPAVELLEIVAPEESF